MLLKISSHSMDDDTLQYIEPNGLAKEFTCLCSFAFHALDFFIPIHQKIS